MNRESLLTLHQTLCQEAYELISKKNQDYSVDQNPYSNFMASEAVTGQPAEMLLLVRWIDKITRISSILSKGYTAVLDESIQDTIRDSINYPILLAGLIAYKAQLAAKEGG